MIITKENTFEFIPKGWSVKSLSEVGTFTKGKGLSANDYDESGNSCILYGDIYVNFDIKFENAINKANVSACEKSVYCKKYDLLFTCSGETAIEIGKAIVYLGNEDLYVGGDIAILTPNVDNDGLFLAYQQNCFQSIKQKARYGQGVSVVHIYPEILKKIFVLVPPLLEQKKISEILYNIDKRIEVQMNLIKKERIFLNSLHINIFNKIMSDKKTKKMIEYEEDKIITLGRGKVISKTDIENKENKYPIYSSSIQNNGLFGKYDDYMFDEELITWSIDGGGNFFYRDKHKFSITNVSGYIRVNNHNEINVKFFELELSFLHKRMKFDYSTKAHPSVIRNLYKLYFPSIKEQRQIGELFILFEQKLSLLEAELKLLKEQKKGLMQQLLTGLIRVNVDEQ